MRETTSGLNALAVAGEEQRLGARVQAQPRTHLPQITFQPRQGALAHGHDAVFFAFAPDMERAAFRVQVGSSRRQSSARRMPVE